MTIGASSRIEETVIFVVIAYPNPNEVSGFFDSERPIFKPYTDRPEISCFLEAERRMSRIFCE